MKTDESSTLVVSKGTIAVGRDFVDAAIGTVRSHGNIEFRRGDSGEPMLYVWTSTQDIATSERILRDCAAREKLRVTSFKSQAVESGDDYGMVMLRAGL